MERPSLVDIILIFSRLFVVSRDPGVRAEEVHEIMVYDKSNFRDTMTRAATVDDTP